MGKKTQRATGTGKAGRQVATKQQLTNALRKEFPTDTVDVSDGYQQNLHVLVVSRRFDGMDHEKRQDLLWGIIDSIGLSGAQTRRISLVLPLSPADVK